MKLISVSLPEPAWRAIVEAVDFYNDKGYKGSTDESWQGDELLDAKDQLFKALRAATNRRIG